MRVIDCESDGRGCRFRLTLGDSQQREPGLRLPAVPTGLAVGIVSLSELTAQAMELAALVERRARGGLSRRLQQPLASFLRRFEGFRPSTMQLHDFRAPHETLPTIGNEIRL
jgi:hypothetical protein